MADWSMLPCDILGEIALKLNTIEDFVYFSTVCQSWNHASLVVKGERNATKITPWLLLAEKTTENPNHLRKIYNVSNSKSYELSMPETFGARCWGSCYGWVIMLTIDQQVQLYNPLSKDRITSLPSIQNLPIEPFDPLSDDPDWYWRHYVVKFVVLKMPRSNDLLVGVIYSVAGYLAFARPGDQSWTSIDEYVEDVVGCGDLVYIVRLGGHLRYCHIKGISDLRDVKVMDYLPSCRTELDGFDKVYLLNSGVDLLMVVREKHEIEDENHPLDYCTFGFEVFRADFKSKRWMKIEYLGDFSIFVGCNSALSVPLLMAPNNFKRNCIYFTDDEIAYWYSTPGFGGRDMGVYDMETRNVEQFYKGGDTRSSFCPPLFLGIVIPRPPITNPAPS